MQTKRTKTELILLMKLMIRYLLLVFIISLSAKTFATDPDSTYRKDSSANKTEIEPLRILSWNIFMLPAYIFETEYKYKRALGIAEEIKKLNYHIIVFQEAFHNIARSTIAKALLELYPYQYGPGNKSLIRFNSGIWIISKIPLYNSHEIRYTYFKGIDGFTSKGALLMDGCWDGQPFQVIGTHLQANSSYEIRKSQLEQLYANLLKPNEKQGIPQFICGDMNTCYKDCIEYEDMLKILDAENEANIDENEGTNINGSRIDYIFIRKNGFSDFDVNRNIHKLKHNCTKKSNFLSDHYAVGATIQFKYKKDCDKMIVN